MSENLITNGDFATGDFTGWDENTTPGTSIVANACQFDHTGGNIFLGQDFGPIFGRLYSFTYTITANTGIIAGEFRFSGNSSFGSVEINPAIGTHNIILRAINASPSFDLYLLAVNTEVADTITIDNISISLVPERTRGRYGADGSRSRIN